MEATPTELPLEGLRRALRVFGTLQPMTTSTRAGKSPVESEGALFHLFQVGHELV
jgi:hypothetical protein